jgi:hypothetical protein
MPGKRVQLDDETWNALDQLAKDPVQRWNQDAAARMASGRPHTRRVEWVYVTWLRALGPEDLEASHQVEVRKIGGFPVVGESSLRDCQKGRSEQGLDLRVDCAFDSCQVLGEATRGSPSTQLLIVVLNVLSVTVLPLNGS